MQSRREFTACSLHYSTVCPHCQREGKEFGEEALKSPLLPELEMAQMMETEKVDDFEDKVRAMLQRPSKPVNSVTSVKPPNVYWVDRRM